MKRKLLLFVVLFALLSIVSTELSAQCAMCKAAAEEGAKDGNYQSATLNTGIIYLLVMPYLAFCVVGWLWYKNYKRRKKEETAGV